MAVDDNPANLKLLEDMLLQYGYEVRSFPLGRLALAGVEQEPPDLILLDINMPEMNGYEVCEQLKANPRASGIPVIFLSALNALEDKVRGFQSGGVDYIPKPFQFEEVRARVETHLALRRAQQAEHDLLEKTLSGAVGTLWELVQLSSPKLAARSVAVRNIVSKMTTGLQLEDPWQYELAATLCLLGCIALPEEVFERAYCGMTLTPEEEQMFRAHPEGAAGLLSKIPRLEMVAEMIRGQQTEKHPSPGAQMLRLAMELDRKIYRGFAFRSVLAELKLSGRFDRAMLKSLDSYAPVEDDLETRRLPIDSLRVGMVLESDVFTEDGNLLIFKAGTVLTETWIQRLINFAKSRGVAEPLDVRLPKTSDATC